MLRHQLIEIRNIAGALMATTLTLGGTTEVAAQRPPRLDTLSVAELVTELRRRQDFTAAGAVLVQARSPQAQAKLDAVADSLVAFVLSHQTGDGRHRAASSAVSALRRSGSGEMGGVLYAGAADRLLRIAENAVVGTRAEALFAISKLANQATARSYLSRVATSRNGVAYGAVGLLGREMGPEGRAELRRVFEAGLIVDERALQEVYPIARYYNWPETGARRP